MDYRGKRILVCGMARSGQSAAKLLARLGAKVTVQDIKNFNEIKWNFEPAAEKMELFFEKNPDEIIENFDMIIISPGIPNDLPFVRKADDKNIPVIGELELAYGLCPCPVVGVTGTNGKTTVATLTGNIMKKRNPKTIVAGNIGLPFTDFVSDLQPDSLAVVEVSSFQLEASVNFKPRVSAILNIEPDHLDRHKTMGAYHGAKEKIFRNQDKDDFAVLNFDDEYCKAMRPECETVFFSETQKLNEGVFLDGGLIRARMNGINEIIADVARLKVLPENALAAAAISICAGAGVPQISEALHEFTGVEHRLEYVAEIGGVSYYNDSKATNAASAIKGLRAMRRPVVLIGGGYDKQADYDEWIKIFENRVRRFIIIGQTADKIERACIKNSFHGYEKAGSLKEAVQTAEALAREGDCVLLSPACASWDMFEDFEHRGNLFKQYVGEIKNRTSNRGI